MSYPDYQHYNSHDFWLSDMPVDCKLIHASQIWISLQITSHILLMKFDYNNSLLYYYDPCVYGMFDDICG